MLQLVEKKKKKTEKRTRYKSYSCREESFLSITESWAVDWVIFTEYTNYCNLEKIFTYVIALI